jgi:hypothetical protein
VTHAVVGECATTMSASVRLQALMGSLLGDNVTAYVICAVGCIGFEWLDLNLAPQGHFWIRACLAVFSALISLVITHASGNSAGKLERSTELKDSPTEGERLEAGSVPGTEEAASDTAAPAGFSPLTRCSGRAINRAEDIKPLFIVPSRQRESSGSTEELQSPKSGLTPDPKPSPEPEEYSEPLPVESFIPLPLPPTDRVLNDRIAAFLPPDSPDAPKAFTLFPSLPAELRLRIWFSALEHRRFIRVYTTYPDGPSQRYNVHKGLCDGHESRRFPTTLLAVSSEARCAAREFYRVRLPCVPREGSTISDPVLYLNPEWDFVRLFSTKSKAHRPHGVLEFLHDVKKHDPRGIGVLNLVIGKGMLKDLTKEDCAALKSKSPRSMRAEVDCEDELTLAA